MVVWRILDAEHIERPTAVRGDVRVLVPDWGRWVKLRRNRMIWSLRDEGRTSAQIRRALAQCGEFLSDRQVQRIMSEGRDGD